MAMGVGSPASHLDLDHLPLAERRRRLPPPPRAEPSRPAPDRLENDAAAKGASKGEIQQWPGLPRGAQFNPSDSDLLWHLAAEVGSRLACRHPFISEFIKTLDEDKGFGCTHPQDIPGVKPDGHASYFFRTTFMSYNNKNNINWQQVGTPRPIILDTSLQGCKEVFILYTCKTNDSSPQKTDWRLHQFYIGKSKRNEGELVLSKIFYKLNKNQCEWDGKAPAASAQDASVTDDNSKEEKQVEIFCANMTDGNHFVQDDRNNQEQRQTEKYPDQNEISSCKDILDATSFNHENLMNSHIQTDELDHVSLRERYRILLAEKHSSSDSFNVMVSAEKFGMDDFKNSCRQSHAEASRSIPKRESDEISHEGPLDRQDVFSVLQSIQEVSAAPLIINTSGDDSRSQVEDLQDILVSPSESFVDGAAHQRASDYLDRSILNSTYTTPNLEMSETHLYVKTEESTDGIDSETSGAVQLTTDNVGLISTSGGSSPAAPSLHEARNCCDSLENSEHQEDDKVVSFGVDIPFGGNENSQLLSIKPSTLLVDVKLEPTLENDEIYPTESTLVNSHHSSENGGLKENDGVVPKCLPRDGEMDLELFHDKGNLIEKSLADCTCSKHSAVLKHVLESSNAVGSTSSFSSDNCNRISVVLSSEANTTSHKDPVPSLGMKSELTGSRSKFSGLCENNSVNIAEPFVKTAHNRNLSHDKDATYYSRQTKRRKTATDSIEKALEEDAPGLLQILLNRGILVEDIKLYGVEEDDEVLPDCTEIDFEDLENIITKLFPHRASLLKFSAARHVKGEKSIYCLACLISLIEQTRYLQFRDCPVEWGWCRDLQSFIFVFKSHNRIVLERPEYGYATYFFEVVQSLPIEWQIRRLVTAMKLSSCGRTALLENKPLLVGEDLTEGEAQVLKEYGWLPNTGLGTMLNYCDRVVHNRWNEKYSSEWRVKIGKLLMNGYMGGQSVLTCIPEKVVKHVGYENTEIKLEDPL